MARPHPDTSDPSATTTPALGSVRARRVFARLRPYLRGLFGPILLLAILTVVVSVAGLAMPYFLADFLNRATEVGLDQKTLLRLVLWTAGMQIIGAVGGFLVDYLRERIAARVLTRMRQHFFEHLQRLSLRHLARSRIGDLLTRLTRDLSEVQGTLFSSSTAIFSTVLSVGGSIALMGHLSGRLLVAIVILCPSVVLAARAFRTRVTIRAAEVRDANEKTASFLVETVASAKDIRAFGREREVSRRFFARQADIVRKTLRAARTGAAAAALPGLLVTGVSLGVFYYGGILVVRGEERLGDLFAFAALQARVYGPLRGLVGLYHQLLRAAVGFDRVFEILDRPAENVDRDGAIDLSVSDCTVRFRDVVFSHEPPRPNLRGVTCEIPGGKITAIVGRNGSGKSTLVELLLRLHRPDSGTVEIDGVDIAHVRRSSLVAAVGIVTQDLGLRHGTLRDNIVFGRRGITDADVLAAAEAAGLAEFIAKRGEGLFCDVGERGGRLSSGERQRVAWARALIGRKRILVFDEASAHLDARIDAELLQKMLDARGDATTRILVTHRPHHLSVVDHVVLIDDGRIVAEGTHTGLIDTSPEYRRFLGRQDDHG